MKWGRPAFIGFLTFPLWCLLFYVSEWSWPVFESWGPSLAFSFQQAFWSTVGALLIGLLWASSLLAFSSSRFYFPLKLLTLGFTVLPALVWINATFWWAGWFQKVPQGLTAIVAVHTLMNMGLVALGAEELLRSRIGKWSEVAQVLGVKSIGFWWRIALPLVKKDLLLLGFVVFSFCFASLSVPMIFATPQDTTVEVLIFQWGIREGRWSHALVLSLLQWAGLASVALILGGPRPQMQSYKVNWRPWVRKEGALLFLVPVVFLGWTYLDLFQKFFSAGFWSEVAAAFSWPALLGSLTLSFSTALLMLVLLLLVSFMQPQRGLRLFLLSYVAPSLAVIGVVFFLLPGESVLWDILKLAVGLSLAFFPGLYRWLGDSHFQSLKAQVRQAEVLGASSWQIASRVVWPQSVEVFSWVTGLAVLWAVSDFALSTMLLQRPYSLALIAETALSRYRVDVGSVYTMGCLSLGLVFFYLLRRGLGVRN